MNSKKPARSTRSTPPTPTPTDTPKARRPAASASRATTGKRTVTAKALTPAAGAAAAPASGAKTPAPPRGVATRRTKSASDVPAATPEAAVAAARPRTVPAAVAARREVTDEDIRVRAYFLALEHRGNGRSAVDFWLQAERELRGEFDASDR